MTEPKAGRSAEEGSTTKQTPRSSLSREAMYSRGEEGEGERGEGGRGGRGREGGGGEGI